MRKSAFVSSLALIAILASMGGCGLAETSAVAVSQAESAAEQAKQGKELEDKVQRDIEAANQVAADQRAAAEAQSQ
jgi:ABC-type thiamine transport system substrate-binding protein